MRRTAPFVFLAGLLVACSTAPEASVSPAPEASASVPSPRASATPSATRALTARPTTAPETTPPPAEVFAWGEPVALVGKLPGLDRPKLVFARGAFVWLDQSQLWVSADAIRWDVADSPVEGNAAVEVRDLAAGDGGFVAVGSEDVDADDDGMPEGSNAVVLTSSDGHRWDRVADPRFAHAGMNVVAMSRQGVVAFGYTEGVGASIWTSVDGKAWLKATNPTGLQVAQGVQVIAETDGRLTAFVDDESGPIEVWQTEGRADWEKVGELPDPSDAHVHRAAYGDGRWIALGVRGEGTGIWSSTDGANWIHETLPPDAYPAAIAGWPGGLIAAGSTGSEPFETCGGSEPWVGRTWLSTGTSWQALPPTEGAAIKALVVANDRIVGIGWKTRENGDVDLVRWSATLPSSPQRPAPTPTPTPTAVPTPAPSRDGCGS